MALIYLAFQIGYNAAIIRAVRRSDRAIFVLDQVIQGHSITNAQILADLKQLRDDLSRQ